MDRRMGLRYVLAVAVVFVATVLLIMSNRLDKEVNYIGVRWVLVVYLTLAIISMGILSKYFSTRYDRSLSGDQTEGSKQKLGLVLEKNALPLAVVIFGSAGITLRSFYALSDFQCIHFFEEVSFHPNNNTLWLTGVEDDSSQQQQNYSEVIPRLIYNLVVLTFFCLQMPFLQKLHPLRARKAGFWLHHLLLLIAGANFSVWYRAFYRDAYIINSEHLRYGTTPLEATTTLEAACFNFSTAANVYRRDSLKHILLPFNMKYMLVSLELLLHVWLLPVISAPMDSTGPEIEETKALIVADSQITLDREDSGLMDISMTVSTRGSDLTTAPEHGPESIEHQATGTTNERACDDDSKQVFHDLQVGPKWYVRWYCKLLHIICNFYTALIVGVIHSSYVQFYVVNSQAMVDSVNKTTYMTSKYFESTIATPLVTFRIFFVFLPSLVVAAHCAVVLSRSKVTRPQMQVLTGKNIMLVLAIVACVVLTCFSVITCVIKLHTAGPSVYTILVLIESCLPAPLFFTEAMIVHYGRRRNLTNKSHWEKSIQPLLSYLAMFNFIHWLTDSFFAYQFFSMRSEFYYVTSSGLNAWDALMQMFLPPCFYFEYSCCLQILSVKRLLCEVDKNGHKETELEDTANAKSPDQNYETVDSR